MNGICFIIAALTKRKGIGQKLFSARVVDLWNELDDSIVSSDSVTACKRKLGKLGY